MIAIACGYVLLTFVREDLHIPEVVAALRDVVTDLNELGPPLKSSSFLG